MHLWPEGTNLVSKILWINQISPPAPPRTNKVKLRIQNLCLVSHYMHGSSPGEALHALLHDAQEGEYTENGPEFTLDSIPFLLCFFWTKFLTP